MLQFLCMFAFYQVYRTLKMTLSLTQCTLSRLSLRHAVRRPGTGAPGRSPSLHFTCASRDSLIIGIYLARLSHLSRLSRQVLDRPQQWAWPFTAGVSWLSQTVRVTHQ